ncbi:uncharacterized protein [Venturia canescens]|uniref:uncharacterized protein isoform X2 n=1 Tax=Venturia canescens TaxID=32260 RepID=UPI001C9C7013|nr:uncharacterized protein LOC122415049 isoform X2 [Venturia canescens]
MKFFVIPYLLAVDLVVPSGRFDYKPTFFFHVVVHSSATVENSRSLGTDYTLEGTMSCTPDPISLWCCFKNTKITHDQIFLNYSSRTILPADPTTDDPATITNEKFLLEFDETGVKISSCNEKSERSLRMIQKIVDLLNVDVDFDGERRGSSRLETLTIVDDCPVKTRANFRPLAHSNPRKLEDGFFKLMSHPDDFDETAVWVLDVNRTKEIANCKRSQDFFFGSRGHNDVLHGSKLSSNVTSSTNKIKMTNENFTSTSYTEGTMTSKTIKFLVKDTITVSIDLNDIYVPAA